MSGSTVRRLFPVVAVVCLASMPVSYAYDTAAVQPAVIVRAADPGAAPSGRVFGRAISSVIPGDLFYVDASNSPSDIRVALGIANAAEVSRYLGYLILRVGTYARDDSGAPEFPSGGKPLHETVISLANPEVAFSLPGNAAYRLTVDGGSFRAIRPAGAGDPSPRFYIRVD